MGVYGLRDGGEVSLVCDRAPSRAFSGGQRRLRANRRAPRLVTRSGNSVVSAAACARSGATCLPTRWSRTARAVGSSTSGASQCFTPGSSNTSRRRPGATSASKVSGVSGNAWATSGESWRLGAATAIRPPGASRGGSRLRPGEDRRGGRGRRGSRHRRMTRRETEARWPRPGRPQPGPGRASSGSCRGRPRRRLGGSARALPCRSRRRALGRSPRRRSAGRPARERPPHSVTCFRSRLTTIVFSGQASIKPNPPLPHQLPRRSAPASHERDDGLDFRE